jgi:hypothetical protein
MTSQEQNPQIKISEEKSQELIDLIASVDQDKLCQETNRTVEILSKIFEI